MILQIIAKNINFLFLLINAVMDSLTPKHC